MLQPVHTGHNRVSTPAFQLRPGACSSRETDDHEAPLEAVHQELTWCTPVSSGSSVPRTWQDIDQSKPLKMQTAWVLGPQHHFALKISSCQDGTLADVGIARIRSLLYLYSYLCRVPVSREGRGGSPEFLHEVLYSGSLTAQKTARIYSFAQTLCPLQLFLPCLPVNPMRNDDSCTGQLKSLSSSTLCKN